MELQLRSARDEDRAFVEHVYFETQRWIIEKLFGWRGNDTERAKFAATYAMSRSEIIVVDGVDAGWMQTGRRAEGIDLEGIYILADYRGRGIGTTLIRALIAEATERSGTLTLCTAKINPARSLYERLGFAVVSEHEYKVYMRYARR